MPGNDESGRGCLLQALDAARRGRDRHGRERRFTFGRDPSELIRQHRIEVGIGLESDLLDGLIHRER